MNEIKYQNYWIYNYSQLVSSFIFSSCVCLSIVATVELLKCLPNLFVHHIYCIYFTPLSLHDLNIIIIVDTAYYLQHVVHTNQSYQSRIIICATAPHLMYDRQDARKENARMYDSIMHHMHPSAHYQDLPSIAFQVQPNHSQALNGCDTRQQWWLHSKDRVRPPHSY